MWKVKVSKQNNKKIILLKKNNQRVSKTIEVNLEFLVLKAHCIPEHFLFHLDIALYVCETTEIDQEFIFD